MAKEKELIEFRIRGKISYLNHWVTDKISQKADYALTLTSHLTSLLTICQMEKPKTLELLHNLYNAYKVGIASHPPTRVRDQIKSMDTNDND